MSNFCKPSADHSMCVPATPSWSRIGYGCDGLDNNCDGIPDDCGEDHVVPTLHVSESLAVGVWYKDAESLHKSIKNTVWATDDCSDASVEVMVPQGSCEESTVTVKAKDCCGNVAYRDLSVFLDKWAPVVKVSAAVTTLNAVQAQYVDIGLNVQVEDNCDDSPLVTARVYSNEFRLNAQRPTTIIYPIYNSDETFKTFQVFLMAKYFVSCDPAFGKLCIDSGKGRTYTIEVCATDKAGWKECKSVTVDAPKPHSDEEGKIRALAGNDDVVVTDGVVSTNGRYLIATAKA